MRSQGTGLILSIIVVSLFCFNAYGDDKASVIIVHNGSPEDSWYFEDAENEPNNVSAIKSILYSIRPDIQIHEVPVKNSQSFKNKFEKKINELKNPLAAVIFLGHSNERSYSPNRKLIVDGNQLAKIIARPLQTRASKRSLLFYFAGCSTANTYKIKKNLQQSFFDAMTPSETDFSVVGHLGTTGTKIPSFVPGFSFERRLGRTFISRWSLSFSEAFFPLVAGYSPTIANMFMLTIPALLVHFIFPEWKQTAILTSFLSLGVFRFLSHMRSKMAKEISTSASERREEGFAYDFIKSRLSTCGKSLRDL